MKGAVVAGTMMHQSTAVVAVNLAYAWNDVGWQCRPGGAGDGGHQ